MGRNAKGFKNPWLCNKCVSPRSNGAWKNQGSCTHCSNCRVEKGKCHLRTLVPGPPRSDSGGHLGTPQTPLEKAQAKTIAEQKKLLEANKETNKDKPGEATDETEGVAGGGSEESTAALQKELDTCKSSLAALPDGDFTFLADTRNTLDAR